MHGLCELCAVCGVCGVAGCGGEDWGGGGAGGRAGDSACYPNGSTVLWYVTWHRGVDEADSESEEGGSTKHRDKLMRHRA